MAKIEDKELSALFKTESSEHIQDIERLLIALEASPDEAGLVEEAFRAVHSLKGAARMLGVEGVELVSHRIEDVLSPMRHGRASLDRSAADRIYTALDAIKNLVIEAVTGEPSGVEVSRVLDMLEGKGGGEGPVGKGGIEGIVGEASEKIEEGESGGGGGDGGGAKDEAAKTTVSGAAQTLERTEKPFRIETIRVDTARLDGLLTHAGELAVMKNRFGRLPAELDEAVSLWEELKRLSSGARVAMASSSGSSGAVAARFNERHRAVMEGLGRKLSEIKDSAYAGSRRLSSVAERIEEGVREIRLIPFSAILPPLQRMARDMARDKGKEVTLAVTGADVLADKRIIEGMKDPLMHMIRNSVDHGIEDPSARAAAGKPAGGTVSLSFSRTEGSVVIEVSDDGRGLDLDGIRTAVAKKGVFGEKAPERITEKEAEEVIFSPGFSTSRFITDVSGRGVGLDVVRANVEALRGSIETESANGRGFAVRVKVPVTLLTARALIASLRGWKCALPVDFVRKSLLLRKEEIFFAEGREAAVIDGLPVSIADLSGLIGQNHGKWAGGAGVGGAVREKNAPQWPRPCVVISDGRDTLGVLVDSLLSEEEVLIKENSPVLKRVRNVTGFTILPGGEVCAVLNPSDLISSYKKRLSPAQETPEVGIKDREELKEKVRAVLVVEDSITTRTQMKRILQGAGYETVTAVDGLDALEKLSSRRFDAVVSDVLMPNMDGLSLTARIRGDERLKGIPVILVTTLASDEDKLRGLTAGANAYIPKPAFRQEMLVETLKRLI